MRAGLLAQDSENFKSLKATLVDPKGVEEAEASRLKTIPSARLCRTMKAVDRPMGYLVPRELQYP